MIIFTNLYIIKYIQYFQCDLYKLLISYVGGFILSAGCQEFQIIEEIILKIIIEYNNNSLWSSILASDLICLVDRYVIINIINNYDS